MIYNPVMKESVKVGDIAAVQELDNIKDTLIIIEYNTMESDYGTVVYVGKAGTEESFSYMRSKDRIFSFTYNDSAEEGVLYDE